jgi:hypothetical protein
MTHTSHTVGHATLPLRLLQIGVTVPCRLGRLASLGRAR